MSKKVVKYAVIFDRLSTIIAKVFGIDKNNIDSENFLVIGDLKSASPKIMELIDEIQKDEIIGCNLSDEHPVYVSDVRTIEDMIAVIRWSMCKFAI